MAARFRISNSQVSGDVSQINDLTKQIAALNPQIAEVKATGQDGGTLQDQQQQGLWGCKPDQRSHQADCRFEPADCRGEGNRAGWRHASGSATARSLGM